MKLRIFVLTGILTAHSAIAAGLVLHSGESYTYEFSTLPFKQVSTWWPEALTRANLYWGVTPLTQGTQLEVRLYENTPADPPLISNIWYSETGLSGNFDLYPPRYPNVWQDLQGAFSLAVLSGSAEITRVDIYSDIPVDAVHSFTYRLEIQPVPEPTPAALFAIGAAVALMWSGRRRYFTRAISSPRSSSTRRHQTWLFAKAWLAQVLKEIQANFLPKYALNREESCPLRWAAAPLTAEGADAI